MRPGAPGRQRTRRRCWPEAPGRILELIDQWLRPDGRHEPHRSETPCAPARLGPIAIADPLTDTCWPVRHAWNVVCADDFGHPRRRLRRPTATLRLTVAIGVPGLLLREALLRLFVEVGREGPLLGSRDVGDQVRRVRGADDGGRQARVAEGEEAPRS